MSFSHVVFPPVMRSHTSGAKKVSCSSIIFPSNIVFEIFVSFISLIVSQLILSVSYWSQSASYLSLSRQWTFHQCAWLIPIFFYLFAELCKHNHSASSLWHFAKNAPKRKEEYLLILFDYRSPFQDDLLFPLVPIINIIQAYDIKSQS